MAMLRHPVVYILPDGHLAVQSQTRPDCYYLIARSKTGQYVCSCRWDDDHSLGAQREPCRHLRAAGLVSGRNWLLGTGGSRGHDEAA
ncbi:MAG: hypothetical protein CL878_13365 [Dehalococcoidia bacterium]|nr:hypothetical protein [Dehalococcoidia bacterium]